ncbi:MAG: PD40 domain-containing protein [Anaerolineae bacterium]|nr:PD40 domain-containing protein [Anaerolineae bacterium]
MKTARVRWVGIVGVLVAASALVGCGQTATLVPSPAPPPPGTAQTLAPTWTLSLAPTAAPTRTHSSTPTVTPTPLAPTPDIASRILFVSERDGPAAIYYLDVDRPGLTPVRLTASEDAETTPSFSPDGRYIAYVAQVWGDPDIFVRAAGDPAQVMQLTRHTAADEWPAWSPDGRLVLFASDRDGTDRFSLYLAPLACGRWGAESLNGAMVCETQIQRVTDAGTAADVYPAWAPGEAIVFASNRHDFDDFDLYTVLPGTDPVRLTGSRRTEWFPAWSPDGQQVAFVSGGPETGFQLYVAQRDGTHVRRLTGAAGGQDSFPVWSPDGGALAYVSTAGGARDVYIIDLASGESRRLTDDGCVVMVGDWAAVER